MGNSVRFTRIQEKIGKYRGQRIHTGELFRNRVFLTGVPCYHLWYQVGKVGSETHQGIQARELERWIAVSGVKTELSRSSHRLNFCLKKRKIW